MKNKKLIIIFGIGIGIILASLVLLRPVSADLLTKYNLDGLSDEELVYKLENFAFDNPDVKLGAGIYGDRIEIADETGQQVIEITNDKFYVSIAPYINSTHG